MKEKIARAQKKDPMLLLNLKRPIMISGLIAVLLFLVTSILLIAQNHFIDEKVFSLIKPQIKPGTTELMHFFSFLGNHVFLTPASLILILYFIYRKKKWMAIETATVMIGGVLLMSLLKRLIGRDRPPFPLVDGVTNFSFPSGHSFMSMAFYGLMIWYAIAYIETKWLKRTVIFLSSFLIVVIGFSRIYLRVHYVSDVIAGFCCGYLWLIACIWFVDKRESKAMAGK